MLHWLFLEPLALYRKLKVERLSIDARALWPCKKKKTASPAARPSKTPPIQFFSYIIFTVFIFFKKAVIAKVGRNRILLPKTSLHKLPTAKKDANYSFFFLLGLIFIFIFSIVHTQIRSPAFTHLYIAIFFITIFTWFFYRYSGSWNVFFLDFYFKL